MTSTVYVDVFFINIFYYYYYHYFGRGVGGWNSVQFRR